ncbi:hypothetical protein JXA88_19075 [Candidatus Fermentibacteria bacterium]|nr:hypothetical protein [Candidatus Fermentibacteria bacterium]
MRRLLSHSLHLSLWVQDAGGRGVPVTKQRWPVQYHSFGWIYTQYGRFSANGGEAYRILPSELPPCGPEELLGITLLIYPARRITPYGLMGILALGVAIAQPATIIAATAF